MENKKGIKLVRSRGLFNQKVLLIGESIDWRAMGNKVKRASLKKQGVELTLVKKSYMSFFVEDLSLFKGNVIVVSFSKPISSQDLENIIVDLEKDLGILSLFLIENQRVISIKYLKSLLGEGVTRESYVSLLASTLKSKVQEFSVLNKGIIKVISKVKVK